MKGGRGEKEPLRGSCALTTMELEGITEKVLEELRQQHVSRINSEPLYLQAARSIEAILDMYTLSADVPMPPELEMAAALGIGRATLRQALSHLTKAGRLYSQRGVGWFLTPPGVLNRPAQLNSLYDDLEARGLQPTTQVLELDSTPASADDAAELHIPKDSPLVHVRRIRSACGQPVAVIDNLLNLAGAAAPSISDLERTGLYATLRRKYGIELAMGSMRVSARLASEDERRWLGLPSPCAVLIARRLSFDTRGRGVEIGTTVYAEAAEIADIPLQPSPRAVAP